jgi:hypothetical protein
MVWWSTMQRTPDSVFALGNAIQCRVDHKEGYWTLSAVPDEPIRLA